MHAKGTARRSLWVKNDYSHIEQIKSAIPATIARVPRRDLATGSGVYRHLGRAGMLPNGEPFKPVHVGVVARLSSLMMEAD
jgi:hypothetical protein